MKTILFSLLFSFFSLLCIAQQETKAKVHLTNGDVISGVLVEYIPGDHLTIRTVGNTLVTIPQAEIRSVDMGNGAAQQTTAAQTKSEEQNTLGNVYFENHSEALMAVGITATGAGNGTSWFNRCPEYGIPQP